MSYYKRPKKYLFLPTILIVLFLFIYLLNYYTYILSPIQTSFYSLGNSINNRFSDFGVSSKILKENKNLKTEINELLIEKNKLKIYKEENILLREKLDFFEKELSDYKFVTARVVAKDIDNSSILIINKGTNDGIINGLPVIVSKGIIIGKTFDCSPYKSKILLLRDSRSLLSGKVFGKSKESHLIMGRYGLSMRIELIPQDIEIKSGDIVVTDGIEENIIQGLVIGKIDKIEMSDNDLFKSAMLQPLISYNDISIISVLLPD